MNLGKVQKNIYIGNTGARYIRNGYFLYIGILSGVELKKKKCLFPIYIRRKSIYRKIHKFWAKPKKRKGVILYIYSQNTLQKGWYSLYIGKTLNLGKIYNEKILYRKTSYIFAKPIHRNNLKYLGKQKRKRGISYRRKYTIYAVFIIYKENIISRKSSPKERNKCLFYIYRINTGQRLKGKEWSI